MKIATPRFIHTSQGGAFGINHENRNDYIYNIIKNL
jgi:hypothetical protein